MQRLRGGPCRTVRSDLPAPDTQLGGNSRARRLAVAASLIGLAGLSLGPLTACGHDEGFDEAAYCRAIKADPGIDINALESADNTEELAKALEVYTELRDLAPPELTRQWSQIVRDLDSMVKAANDSIPVTGTDYPGFAEALTAIDQDQQARCQ